GGTGGMKQGACRAVRGAMRWAQKKGYIAQSPVADYEKPRPGKRKVVVGPAEFEQLLSLAGGQHFRDLLVVTWETACRPQESLIVEARHVDLKNARWVFPADEAKGEEWPRIVYLTDTALDVTRRLMLKHPEGPIFRNAHGVPWTPLRGQLRLHPGAGPPRAAPDGAARDRGRAPRRAGQGRPGEAQPARIPAVSAGAQGEA